MKYRPDIDGLRAVAVLLVLFFHAFPKVVSGGFVGVDIFFVISGYLISGVIFTRMAAGTYTFADFYRRRILRIFPALIVCLFSVLLIGWFSLWPVEYAALGKHVACGAGFISNILLYLEVGYFDQQAYFKPLLNLWSLGIEEQFYFIFPFILWLLWRFGVRLFWPVLGLCFLSFIDNIWLSGAHPDADFYLPLSRFWELLAGASLRLAFTGDSKSGAIGKNSLYEKNARNYLGVAGFLLLIVAMFVCDQREGNYPGWLALIPAAGAISIIAAGENSLLNRILLANGASVFIGKISYTLYLWHWPLLSLAYIMLGKEQWDGSPGLRACLLILAFILAALTWLWVETPIRYGAALGRQKIPILCLAMTCACCLGIWAWRDSGLPFRFSSHDQEIFSQLADPPTHDQECLDLLHASKDDYAFCRFFNANAGQTIALLGDSHAQSAFSGIAELGKQEGFNTIFLGRLPQRKDQQKEIAANIRNMLNYLNEHPEIKIVVIAIRGPSYLYTEHNPGERRYFDLPNRNYEDLKAELDDFLRQLTAMGKTPIILEDNPDLDINIREALPREIGPFALKPKYAETSRKDALSRQAAYGKMLDEFDQIPGVITLRGVFDAFCPKEPCELFDENGMPLYYDDDHLSLAGSRRLAQKILKPTLLPILEKTE